jgi:hypothetical protein
MDENEIRRELENIYGTEEGTKTELISTVKKMCDTEPDGGSGFIDRLKTDSDLSNFTLKLSKIDRSDLMSAVKAYIEYRREEKKRLIEELGWTDEYAATFPDIPIQKNNKIMRLKSLPIDEQKVAMLDIFTSVFGARR